MVCRIGKQGSIEIGKFNFERAVFFKKKLIAQISGADESDLVGTPLLQEELASVNREYCSLLQREEQARIIAARAEFFETASATAALNNEVSRLDH